MDQRISFVTLAVADLDRTRAFYVDGLGWKPELFVPGEVLMIRAGDKLILSLWSEAGFEAEVGPIRRGEGVVPITLAHNVRHRGRGRRDPGAGGVDRRRGERGRAPRLGRLHRLLRRPRRLPLGDRHEPRRDRPARPAMTTLALEPFECRAPAAGAALVRARRGSPPARRAGLAGAGADRRRLRTTTSSVACGCCGRTPGWRASPANRSATSAARSTTGGRSGTGSR